MLSAVGTEYRGVGTTIRATLLPKHPVENPPCLLGPPGAAEAGDEGGVGNDVRGAAGAGHEADERVRGVEVTKVEGVHLEEDAVGGGVRGDAGGDHVVEHGLSLGVSARRDERVHGGGVAAEARRDAGSEHLVEEAEGLVGAVGAERGLHEGVPVEGIERERVRIGYRVRVRVWFGELLGDPEESGEEVLVGGGGGGVVAEVAELEEADEKI